MQFSKEEFKPEYDKRAAWYEKLAERIAAIQREKDYREYRAKRISLFMRLLAGQEKCMEFDPVLFKAFMERVAVTGTKRDVRLDFVLRDRREWKVKTLNMFSGGMLSEI